MKNEPLEVIRGSGNVYRDLGQDDADVKQFKALLAATGRVKPGGYYGPTGFGGIRGVAGEAKRAPQAEDPALAKRLWDVSVAMTGIDPGLPAI